MSLYRTRSKSTVLWDGVSIISSKVVCNLESNSIVIGIEEPEPYSIYGMTQVLVSNGKFGYVYSTFLIRI